MGVMPLQSSKGVLNRCSNLSFKELTSEVASPRMKVQSAESVEGCEGFDFEFGNSRSLDEKSEEMDVFGRPASMVFADELFSNGQVMPLKLPPRLEGVSSVVGSPTRSPSSGLKHAFQKMWSDDFDPFQKAAEKVREQDKKGESRRRRSRSVLPLRAHQWTIDDLNMSDQDLNLEHYSESESQSCRWSQWNDKSTELQTETKINGVAQPRGLIIARKLRPLSIDQVTDIKQAQMPLSPIKEKKKHRVRKLLSRSATIAKEWSSAGDHKEMSWMQSFGFKSVKKSKGNLTKSVSSEKEIKTVVQYQYRPKMLLCIGFQNKLPGK